MANSLSLQQTVEYYFENWKNKRFAAMNGYVQLTVKSKNAFMPSQLYKDKTLLSYKILSINSKSKVLAVARVHVVYKMESTIYNKISTVNIIKEVEPYTPSVNGTWGINPISGLRENDN